MTYGEYLTPSQSAIFIGPYHVDDAYSVEWSYKDSRAPLYNYFQDEVITSSLGKKIVVGTLAINYRFPGYLPFAIGNVHDRANDAELGLAKANGSAYVDYYLDQMKKSDASARMRMLLEAAIVGPLAMQRMSALTYLSQTDANYATGSNTKFPDVFAVQKPDLDVIPVDIWTHFGDLDRPHVAQKIEGVVFVGESQQIQAGASPAGGLSASGVNILEVYSFWAKKVEKFRFDPEEPNTQAKQRTRPLLSRDVDTGMV